MSRTGYLEGAVNDRSVLTAAIHEAWFNGYIRPKYSHSKNCDTPSFIQVISLVEMIDHQWPDEKVTWE
jgi:hypothetical protein